MCALGDLRGWLLESNNFSQIAMPKKIHNSSSDEEIDSTLDRKKADKKDKGKVKQKEISKRVSNNNTNFSN